MKFGRDHFEINDANLQRMLEGQAPIGRDGLPINLHHRGQIGASSTLSAVAIGCREPGDCSAFSKDRSGRLRDRRGPRRSVAAIY